MHHSVALQSCNVLSCALNANNDKELSVRVFQAQSKCSENHATLQSLCLWMESADIQMM